MPNQPQCFFLLDRTELRLDDFGFFLYHESHVKDLGVELSGEDSAVYGNQALNLAASALSQQLESLGHSHYMVGMVLGSKDVGLGKRLQRLEKLMACDYLPIQLYLLNQSALFSLLHINPKVV